MTLNEVLTEMTYARTAAMVHACPAVSVYLARMDAYLANYYNASLYQAKAAVQQTFTTAEQDVITAVHAKFELNAPFN